MATLQIPFAYLLFLMLYGAVTVIAVIACVYLLLRKGNAFAVDVTPAVLLRRWVVTFFAVMFLSHVWWVLLYASSFDIHSTRYVAVLVLDTITLLPSAAGTLIYMLQDRKRPFWPVVVAMVPPVVLGAMQVAHPDGYYLVMETIYSILFYLLLTVYIVFSVRQYGRWLRDNYADLERKEVWQTQLAVMVCLLVFVLYWADGGDNMLLAYLLQLTILVLYALLLWRVETLPLLDEAPQARPEGAVAAVPDLGSLLAEHCEGPKLYLQHGLTLAQLSKAVGTNRFYLSQYFAAHGTTYNAYINGLRINHFVSSYRDVQASGQPFTAQQLASQCGYRSYSTFSLAFKQRMGQSVTAWIHREPSFKIC